MLARYITDNEQTGVRCVRIRGSTSEVLFFHEVGNNQLAFTALPVIQS